MSRSALTSCGRPDAAQAAQRQDRSAHGLATFLSCLLGTLLQLGDLNVLMASTYLVLWTDAMALRDGHVVLVHVPASPRLP
jgi:hypothetical protein